MGRWRLDSATEDLRVSLGLRYARFDILDFCSTETSSSPLVLGTRDALRADWTLDVGDGCGCGESSLVGFGSHGCCRKEGEEM